MSVLPNTEIMIYVFSGTGTSLSVAKTIGDRLGNAEIRLIPEALRNAEGNKVKPEAGTVGLVFPNYFGGIPSIVADFIRKLDLIEASYVFAVVTAGGGQGYSLKFLERALSERGVKLDYGRYVKTVSNYIVAWYYKLICATGERRSNTLGRLDKRAKRIAEDVAFRKKGVEHSRRLVYMVNRGLSPSRIIKDTRPWDKQFSIGQNCAGCGICEKVCQFSNIKMVNRVPEFQHNCRRCMACLQYCPQRAIEFKGKPLDKTRYYHPNYPAKEMIRLIHSENKEQQHRHAD